MASGKLSPRQKMINMMYLVLLALLAMNVSKEVLDAFQNLKQKLASSANNAQVNADGFMENMIAKIQDEIENENKDKNKGLMTDTIPMIKSKTNAMIASINDHIAQMEVIAGIDSITGDYKAKDELEKNYQYWMGRGDSAVANDEGRGPRGSAAAFGLRNEMQEYYNWVADLHNANSGDSAQITARTIRDTVDTETDQPKSWEEYTFDAPVIANMAVLEAMKVDVYEQQKILLDKLNERLGVANFKIDKLEAGEAPSSQIVPAGLQYKTELFVKLSSSQIKPTFSSGSGSVKIAEDGNSGLLTIRANGNLIKGNAKQATQNYTAMVRVKKANGEIEELPVKGSFVVRKPEIVVTSAAVQNLYYNCGNDVNIDVPALGDLYSPNVTCTNGTVIASKKTAKKFRIVPTGKTCVVTVKNVIGGASTEIGKVNYKVIRPPKPTIQMRVNGKPTSGATPVAKNSRVQLYLDPDDDFKSALPADARYGIKSIDVLAQLSLGPPQKVNGLNTGGQDATKPISVKLGNRVRQARPGTKVYIRINEVFRKNFKGQNITDKRFSEVERTLSIVVK